MRRSQLSIPVLLASVSALAQYPGSQPPPTAWKQGFDSISAAEGRGFLSYLAGPECLGRGTGQPGYFKAAQFMAAHFQEYGLKPMGDRGTYFQGVPFWRSNVVDDGSQIQFIGSSQQLKSGQAFRMTSISAPISATSLVAEISGDDPQFDPADLVNKIVIVKTEKPSLRMRSQILAAKPSALLFVRPSLPAAEYQVRRSAPSPDAPARSPYGYISDAGLRDLEGAMHFGDMASGAGSIKLSTSFARMNVKIASGDLMVPNVVGLLEGSDPTLKAEIVGLGAHLDHLGVQGGVVYPGADDDGSGDTALLEIARAFHMNGQKPKRSLLFMAFCGEEMGLIGSGWYAAHPVFPNDKMVAELQMDMVGRNSFGAQNGDQKRIDVEAENHDTIRLVGSKRISTDLHNTILDMNKYVGFKFKYDAEDVYTRSDHYNFAKNGIPIAFTFSGFHPDYHQPTDTIEKINFEKIANTARLYYLTAASISDNPVAPRHDVKQ
jgi:hypothetical protein